MPSPSNTSPRQPGRNGPRLIALFIAIPFLLLIGALVAIPFIAADEVPLNAVGPIGASEGAERGGVVFRGTANIWEVRGNMTENAAGALRFDFQLIGPTGQPPPAGLDLRLQLTRADGSAEQTLPFVRTGQGSFQAQTPPLPTGRWQLRLVFPEVVGIFGFDTGGTR